jgi:PKD repeat protein
MRSIPLMAVSTLVLASAWACGGDNGNGPNQPPVAAFTAPSCTVNTACAFADASTDPDGSIASRTWDFGDPASGSANAAQDANPSHTFATAGTYQVKLTVTDNSGASDDVTNAVTVTGGTGGGQAPTSSFDLPSDPCVAGTPCGFHSTSTDPDGDITAATFSWNFGDGSAAATTPDATHTFAQAGTYTVTLNVTDTQGLTGTSSQQLTVSPAASQDCTTSALASGTRIVSCSLTMTQRSTLKFTVQSRSCQLAANQLRVTAPVDQYIFFNLCTRPVGTEVVLHDAAGNPLVLEAGTPVAFRFEQGTGGPSDPATGDPGIRIDNPSPNNWTLNIDDGGAPGTPGEPDFNDAIITVTATAAP